MTKHISIFKLSEEARWEVFAQNLFAKIRQAISGDEEFQVEIKPCSKRSQNALNAYWMLIDRVVKWDAENNRIKKDVWDEWFRREADLTEIVDMMSCWKIKYKDLFNDNSYELVQDDDDLSYAFCSKKGGLSLGAREIEKTRSISNKGDVTKAEMERLLLTVIKFGAENDVPDCFIEDKEINQLLKFYD